MENFKNREFQIENFKFRISIYELRILNSEKLEFKIENFKIENSKIENFKLRISSWNFKSRISNQEFHKLR